MDITNISLFEKTRGTKRKYKDGEINYKGNGSTHTKGLLLLRQRLMKNVDPLHKVQSDCKKLKQKESELKFHKPQSVKRERTLNLANIEHLSYKMHTNDIEKIQIIGREVTAIKLETREPVSGSLNSLINTTSCKMKSKWNQNNAKTESVIDKKYLMIKEEPKDYLSYDSPSTETYFKTNVKDDIKIEPENSKLTDPPNPYEKNRRYTAPQDTNIIVKREPANYLLDPENTGNISDRPNSFAEEIHLDLKVKNLHIYNPELYRKDTKIPKMKTDKAETTNQQCINPHMAHDTKLNKFEINEVSSSKNRNKEELIDQTSSKGRHSLDERMSMHKSHSANQQKSNILNKMYEIYIAPVNRNSTNHPEKCTDTPDPSEFPAITPDISSTVQYTKITINITDSEKPTGEQTQNKSGRVSVAMETYNASTDNLSQSTSSPASRKPKCGHSLEITNTNESTTPDLSTTVAASVKSTGSPVPNKSSNGTFTRKSIRLLMFNKTSNVPLSRKINTAPVSKKSTRSQASTKITPVLTSKKTTSTSATKKSATASTSKKSTRLPTSGKLKTTTASKKLTNESASRKQTTASISKKSKGTSTSEKSKTISASKKLTNASASKKRTTASISKKSKNAPATEKSITTTSSKKLTNASASKRRSTASISKKSKSEPASKKTDTTTASKKLRNASAYKKSTTTLASKKLTTSSTSKKSTRASVSNKSTSTPSSKTSNTGYTSKKSTAAFVLKYWTFFKKSTLGSVSKKSASAPISKDSTSITDCKKSTRHTTKNQTSALKINDEQTSNKSKYDTLSDKSPRCTLSLKSDISSTLKHSTNAAEFRNDTHEHFLGNSSTSSGSRRPGLRSSSRQKFN